MKVGINRAKFVQKLKDGIDRRMDQTLEFEDEGRMITFSDKDIEDINKGFEQDRKALAGDWNAVGNDLRRAMKKIEEEMTEEQRKKLKDLREEGEER